LESKGPDCDCCCGGINHGKGYAKALDNTNRIGEEWIRIYNENNPDHKLIIEKALF